MTTHPAPETDGFFGAVDPRRVRALAIGDRVEITYDELGARRATTYHLVTGTVAHVDRDAERGDYVRLEGVTTTRPCGEVTTRASRNYVADKTVALRIV